MSLEELIWFIFSDELVGALIVPVNHKYALKSAILFNNNIIIYIAAFVGSLAGLTLNFILAKIIKNGLNAKILIFDKKKKFIKFLLIMIPIDIFGAAASFLVAFVGIKLKLYLGLSSLIYLIYYSFKMITNL